MRCGLEKTSFWRRLLRTGPALFKGFLIPVVMVAATGCGNVSGPAYQRPDAPEKGAWSLSPGGTPQQGAEVIKLDWWTAFNDAYLNDLVKRATAGNISVQVAAARLAEAATLIGTAEAARQPSLNASGSLSGSTSGSFTSGRSRPFEGRVAGGVNLGWELDIWGKLQKGIAAQRAGYRASEADWRSVWLLTAADASTTYFLIRQLDGQAAQQRASLAAADHILSVNRQQAEVGLKTATDVLTQQAEVDFIRTGLLDLERRRTLAENALATLLGVPAGEFHVPAGDLQEMVDIPEVPIGLPSRLLSRRPDILAAEYRVLESHELVGQARLAQLPSISLNVDGGAQNLLSAAIASWTFGIGPSIEIPIFNPNIQARIKTSEASAKTAEQEYRLTVINAFKEVEDTLVNLNNRKRQRIEIEDRRRQLQEVAKRVEYQLQNGVVSQLQVLETQRTLLNSSLDLLNNKQQILADTITLFKALGGGWDTTDDIAKENQSDPRKR